MMLCCACSGSCNHVGNHTFCSAHGGTAVPPVTFTTSATWYAPSTCVLCHKRRSDVYGALCDPCLEWAQKPWWRRGRRP